MLTNLTGKEDAGGLRAHRQVHRETTQAAKVISFLCLCCAGEFPLFDILSMLCQYFLEY